MGDGTVVRTVHLVFGLLLGGLLMGTLLPPNSNSVQANTTDTAHSAAASLDALSHLQAALGRHLFQYTGVSRDSLLTCASYHDPFYAFADPCLYVRGVMRITSAVLAATIMTQLTLVLWKLRERESIRLCRARVARSLSTRSSRSEERHSMAPQV